MSQNDFNLANQDFPNMRADMNSAFQALASNSSGATAPSTSYPHQWWYDATANILKMRNAGNTAWINIAAFDQAGGTWAPFVGAIDLTGLTATAAELNILDGVTATAAQLNEGVTKAWVNFNGTGTIAARDSFNVSSLTDNGTGNYTVNFSNAFGAADYSFSINARGINVFIGALTDNAGSTNAANLPIVCIDTTADFTDATAVTAQAFGDLA
jgi:hypothetical protein